MFNPSIQKNGQASASAAAREYSSKCQMSW